MISFDVVSLFTNVPLKQTIDIILRKIYDERKIKTKIPRQKMERLLLLCTQGTPFIFDGKMYVQIDGVMMGSPLGALFANIFMCELENNIVPTLGDKLKHWMRYVDDTFVFVKKGKKDEVQQRLNSYHANIKFTNEVEVEKRISFLDVLVTRGINRKLETSVYRKATNTDVCMNWNAHAPTVWKIATLRSLVKRARLISSTENALQKEIAHLKKVFSEYNNYPVKLIENIIEAEINIRNGSNDISENGDREEDESSHVSTLSVPYAGIKGEQILKKLKKTIESTNTNAEKKQKVRIVYTAKKLGTKFPVKDKTPKEHLHNVVYHAECPNKKCKSEYTGETKCRMKKRAIQHNSKDEKSHILIHSKRTKHKRVWMDNFKILGQGYTSDYKRKISEALFIKKYKPNLNMQKEALKLSLYN